ncbi:MAG TPA: Flp pilus assembly protein CpaB [Gemmataceae bacterium]|jgi:Flp pilus assembly protein CpaB|nr:Flp pilus assembly protein CpaB [Gemmataceae bacterium]
MKQKNLAMLGVAVGCGLVAAVAVAKLSAGGKTGPETVKVLVAKKDLPVQTPLDEKDIDNLLQWADMPKNFVPPDAVTDIETVKGKSLTRTLKQGNPVAITDLGSLKVLEIPAGFKAFTVKCSPVDAVGGFAKPGSKVDVMFVEKTGTGKTRAAIILQDMLVLALNQTNTVDEKTGAAVSQVESVSMAVTDKQARLIALADERGKLKLVLRNRTPGEIVAQLKEGEVDWLEDPFVDKPATAPMPQPEAKTKFEQVVMARKPVPMNTLINADNVGDYFTTTEVKSVPEGVVQNPDDLKGLYVIKPVDQGQFLYKSLTGSEMAKVEKPADPVQPAPTPAVAETKKKFPRFETTIQEGGVTKKIIWLEIGQDKWKRFDSEKDADDYKPEADAPKAEAESPKVNQ